MTMEQAIASTIPGNPVREAAARVRPETDIGGGTVLVCADGSRIPADDVPAMRGALEAAEHWLAEEAASPHPGQTRPDDILRVIREALGKPHDATDAAPAARDDSAVLHADAVDDASQWPLPWRFETNDGASYFATEDEACAAQRDHRRRNGFDPMTGEPAPQMPDASALMLAALRDVETRLCDIWERRPEMRGEIAKSRDVVEAAIAAAEGAADA